MKKIFVLIALTMLLSACGPASVEDMIDDPELLGSVLQECTVKMSQGKDVDTVECQNAAEAQRIMAENLMNGMLKQLNQ